MSDELQPYEPTVPMPENDDGVLNFTQQIRAEVITRIMSDVDVNDAKSMSTLTKMLAGMDSQIISMRRIAAHEKSSDAMGDIANILVAHFAQQKDAPKLTRHDDVLEGDYRPVVPELPAKEFIPGQLDPVGAPVDINEIMQKGIEASRE